MAIAGVQNAAAMESTFLRDSHSQSPRRQEDGGRGGMRSSSLLQMWRGIEDEHVVRQVQGRSDEVLVQQRSDGLVADPSQENTNHMTEGSVLGENESETWSQSQSQNGSQCEQDQEELNNASRENSSNIGESGRERVRKVFREWMGNGGSRDHASNVARRNGGSRGDLLGETDPERVSVVREWVEMSSQLRGVSVGENREEQSSEFGNQVECVREGLAVNQNEGQSEHISRRRIRKLRGRQVLLDMVKKAEMERQREVQELLERRAVSHFPHRNRIQALLRGRFLRNDRPIDNIRSTSIAESELGLLRQKQTVSCLREGFSSRKNNSGYSQAANNLSETSSDSDTDVDTIEQTGATSSQVVPSVHSERSKPNNRESDRLGILCACDEEEKGNLEPSSNIRVERSDDTTQNVDTTPTEDTDNGITQQSLQVEVTEHSNMQEQEPSVIQTEQALLGDIDGEESNLSNHNNRVEENIVDDVDSVESVAIERGHHEEIIVENEGSEWNQTNIDWRDSTQESVDDNQLSSTSNEWPQNILGTEDGDNSRLQDQVTSEVWQEDGSFQEAVEIWLGGPSDNEVAPVGRTHGFYFPEDDNVYSVELRELLSRRSVSNLLRSSFRESLDQLIQSYVERRGHAHSEWELRETAPSSPSTEQDLEQQRRDQIADTEDIVNSSLNLPLPPTPPPLPLWDRPSRHDNWSQNSINSQHRGTVHPFAGHNRFPLTDELDNISDLRIDMVRLQQRMNNMQRMLEACMDMQLELQRSIRQEVSAALNRSTGSSGVRDHITPDDKSKWECVRKGLCCICCEGNIDCLLYRCGHMCTCSKCANQLLDSRRKCPMCRAPVVEVIRAYSI
ncbi:hypothetical protein RYX36_010263 [Vicia faba]